MLQFLSPLTCLVLFLLVEFDVPLQLLIVVLQLCVLVTDLVLLGNQQFLG